MNSKTEQYKFMMRKYAALFEDPTYWDKKLQELEK